MGSLLLGLGAVPAPPGAWARCTLHPIFRCSLLAVPFVGDHPVLPTPVVGHVIPFLEGKTSAQMSALRGLGNKFCALATKGDMREGAGPLLLVAQPWGGFKAELDHLGGGEFAGGEEGAGSMCDAVFVLLG